MKEVEISVGGRPYRINVDDTQSERVRKLAGHFDHLFETVRKATGGAFDRDRTMVLAVMMLLDEYENERKKQEDATKELQTFHSNLADRLESLLNS